MKEYTRQKSFKIKREIASKFFKKMDELKVFYCFGEVLDHETLELLVYYEYDERKKIMLLIELMDAHQEQITNHEKHN